MVSQEFSSRTREENLGKMRDRVFDLIVVGGGITGAAIARDAALRGLEVALLEKGDFASGTSSRSSKLIHGGLRYLKYRRFKLVYGALRERWTLRRTVPRLVKPLTFLIPIYQYGKTGRLQLSLGLWLYDLLALFRTERPHEWLGAEQVAEREPAISRDGLVGAGLYCDFRTEDARLVLALIKDAWGRGAVVANYAEVVGFEKERGRIVGIKAIDSISGAKFSVRGRVVVNATGAWSDKLRRLDDPLSEPKLRPTKGVHLVVPRERVGNRGPVVIESPRDGRYVFVLPWCDLSLIGTTDTNYEGDLDHVAASDEDVDYLLEALNQTFPEAKIAREDIISSYASVRPLATELGVAEDEVSRDHLIFESPSGLISIIGGKLTSHRSMAEALVDRVSDRLGLEFGRPVKGGCRTDSLTLGDHEGHLNRAVENLARESGFEAEVVSHLVEAYGPDATKVLEIARESNQLSSRIVREAPHLMAEVRYAARYEMAVRLIDFMFRRTRLAHRLSDHGRSIARSIAIAMAAELGWSPERVENELIGFEEECGLIEVR